ncbi:hypothetical protein LUU34_00315200 [Aix galericulata]|nr:hypothetical protein LUU34_00315200 [Aix galericulata]
MLMKQRCGKFTSIPPTQITYLHVLKMDLFGIGILPQTYLKNHRFFIKEDEVLPTFPTIPLTSLLCVPG